ncbi:hypothetical protein BCV69DRAFT_275716 [Microstroma glucosiphilum]|uniref:Uncharacterized protein n=1 Tax=Pseudomicrostroma glucosiphilum TaxID=1684307 RepID=A0A316UFY8_9BASI|nr:hypothetical protein BCV69DRAFT_275716 [Pseudomicrostroma glucosiphilum]PWN22823.1 hypothetical protein BCV69DRAFT_275716 [Pseudomicrostroma glucosiphilum]
MPPLVVPEHMSTPAKVNAGSSRSSAGGAGDFSSSPTSSYSPLSGGASSRSFGGAGWGLGLSSPAGHSQRNTRGSVDAGMHSATPLPASESSIFERDIEHRDARHVLSKSEAVDVAIPPVLDDAVEAIIEGGDQPLEIVAPLPSVSATPHALSALALSAHSLASSTSSGGPNANSPMIATSSPRSASSALQAGPAAMAADEPPLGSIAAQIAERLGTPRGHTGDATSTAPASAAATAGDHLNERRSRGIHSMSSTASSTGDAGKSRSPGPNAASVQQILEGASVVPGSPLAGRSLFSHTPRDRSPAPQLAVHSRGAHTVATTSHSRNGSLSQQGTSAAIGATPPATSLPSLPLPNPFRSDSPSVVKHAQQPSAGSALGFMESGSATPAPVTMSLDGAIIPSSESAIHEMSLDAMADALADASSDGEISPSPIVPRKASVVAASLPPPSLAFLRRDTNATITAANAASFSDGGGRSASGVFGAQGEDDLDMPGGFPGGTPTKSTASPETRRLSFFSYADIINDTPAELVDFEEVVSREMASGFSDDAHLSSGSGAGGGSKIARSPRASFGGAGLAKPFPAPDDSAAMSGDQSLSMTGSPSMLGKRLMGQNAAF